MTDIELVIKIDEEVYKRLKSLSRGDNFEHDMCGNLMRRIANGTPLSKVLDKTRAEIERMDYLYIEDGSDGYDEYVDRYDVLQIIDKCRESRKYENKKDNK